MSWFSVITKSATNDEPLHLVGGYSHVFLHDYRVNPEDPPLWNYWFMLPHSRGSFHLPTSDPMWQKFLDDSAWNFAWSSLILFTAENEGPRRIETSRAMMLPIGLALGAVIAVWSLQLGGRIAAIVATALFALDPNFIAHAPLIKNDVPITLLIVALSFAVDRCGRHATVLNVVSVALLLGAALNTKFSGVLMIPIVALTLLARAVLPRGWVVLKWELNTRSARLLAAAGITTAALLTAWAMTWTCYAFRFDPTPEPGSRLNLQRVIELTEKNRAVAGKSGEGAVVRVVRWSESRRLLPHAWLYGFLYTYQSSLVRQAFLLSETRSTGWWYYFPLTMLFKTPLATIAALIISLTLIRIREPSGSAAGWSCAALLIPLIVYGLIALTTNLNIGIRHVFPLYPFIFIFIGVTLARAARMKWTIPVIVIALAIESLSAFPNYLAFFNTACGGPRGGIRLLSDSNLDWGQDLPLLAGWQGEHKPRRLYFCFSGSADPAAYGIDYINTPRGYFLNPQSVFPDRESGGVVAITASRLQGVYMEGPLREYYTSILRTCRPIGILGGSIYLFDSNTMPPPPNNP